MAALTVLIDLLLFVVGIPLLWKGAAWLVDGAGAIARRLGLSSFVIGLTIVSFGTSAPEFVVNVVAASRGDTDLVMGTILGSNIANVLLILGISAIIRALDVTAGTIRIGVPFIMLTTAVAFVLLNDGWFTPGSVSELGIGDGIVLLAFFALFMGYIARRPRERIPPEKQGSTMPLPPAILRATGGIVALALGGQWMVDGGLEIATQLGVGTGFVGFAIVAIGTSLPELAASAAASWKSEVDMVVGNIVGSNIFNLLWILGITSLIRPIPLSGDVNLLFAGALGSTILLWFILLKDRQVNRVLGGLLVASYVIFVAWIGLRAL